IRVRAGDPLAGEFPEQGTCGDNHAGAITVPDHPLVTETIENCLREAMDVDGLRDVLDAMDRGEIRTVAVETAAPSPMSHEILNANPYAFLDDAPLEERRARAVSLRRTGPELARTPGRPGRGDDPRGCGAGRQRRGHRRGGCREARVVGLDGVSRAGYHGRPVRAPRAAPWGH